VSVVCSADTKCGLLVIQFQKDLGFWYSMVLLKSDRLVAGESD
jgi:hypothetical protein